MKKMNIITLIFLSGLNSFGYVGSELAGALSQSVRSNSPSPRTDANRYSWISTSPDSDQNCFDRETNAIVPVNQAFRLCPKLNEYGSKYIREYSVEDSQNGLLNLIQVSPDVRHRFVEARRQETLNVIARAYNNPRASDTAKRIYDRLWNHLQRARINYPNPNEEFVTCINNPRYYAYVEYGQIYFCSRSLRSGEDYVVQALIHEVAHSTNIDRNLHSDEECGALMVEYSTMAHAGRQAQVSSYASRCRIRPGFTIQDGRY